MDGHDETTQHTAVMWMVIQAPTARMVVTLPVALSLASVLFGTARADVSTTTDDWGFPETIHDDENPLARKFDEQPASARLSTWFAGLGVGSGFGYAGGAGVESHRAYTRNFSPGLAAPGLAHVLPELGVHLSDVMAISVVGRFQYFPKANPQSTNRALSALARLLLFSGTGPARFYGALAVGGGEGIRLIVPASTNQTGTVRDTVRGGPILAGMGAGFSYALGDTMDWMIETNALAGFPDFSMAFDFNTGVRAHF